MIRTLRSFFLALVILTSSCTSSSTNREPRQKSKQELREELRLRECEVSSSYLSGKLKVEPVFKNALSMKVKGLKLNVSISNSATVATWKDVQGKVKLLSKTGAVIRDYDFDVYEVIGPSEMKSASIEVSIKNQQYKDCKSFSWTIEGATCVH